MEKSTNMCYRFLLLGITISFVSASFLDAVSRVNCRGTSVYIPVKRELLQGIIDTFTGPTLYMPDGPIFAGQPEGTHPLWVDVAVTTFIDFEESEADNPNSYVSTSGIEVTINIPNLVLTPGGPATNSLGIAVLYDGRRRGIPQPDLLYTYIAVEQITVQEDTGLVTIVDGEATITIDLGIGAPCNDAAPKPLQQSDAVETPKIETLAERNTAEFIKRFVGAAGLLKERSDSIAAEEIGGDDTAAVSETDALTGLLFSLGGYQDANFCWYYPAGKTRFCDDVDLIGHVVDFFGANICTVWNSDNEKFCRTTAGKVAVAGWFQHIIPIDEATQTLAADQYIGDYRIGLIFPCV